MKSKQSETQLNILELYSGIGGFHFAIKQLFGCRKYRITAVDINSTANKVYRLNHNHSQKSQLLERNIQSLTVNDLDQMNLFLLTMSPPCQPFSRLGKQKDLIDSRCDSFRHLMNIFPRLQNKPQFIMLENVKGFETSQAHELLIETLTQCNYVFKEFLLSPEQFLVPNSRRRYYLLGKYNDSNKKHSSQIHIQVPVLNDSTSSIFDSNDLKYFDEIFFDVVNGKVDVCIKSRPKIQNYLDDKIVLEEEQKKFYLNDDQLLRYHMIIDLVESESTNTNCFTKSYGHRLEGCGSILKTSNDYSIDEIYEEIKKTKDNQIIIQLLRKLKLRFFTPREIANIMCFPKQLEFPMDLNIKQCYRLLGNSVNVLVCYYLLQIMLGNNLLNN